MWPKFSRLFLLLLITLLLPLPAAAAAFGERTQETVPVGNNRFLIFVGAPEGDQVGYTVDLIQVQDGIPFYVPLFIEDFDADTRQAKLSYGVAFFAKSYTYDRNANIMTLKMRGNSIGSTMELRYRLDNDIFHLQQATAIQRGSQVPQILYKGASKTAVKPVAK